MDAKSLKKLGIQSQPAIRTCKNCLFPPDRFRIFQAATSSSLKAMAKKNGAYSERLQANATQLLPPREARRSLNFAYLTALRPRQWTKNLIVFAAPLFGFKISLDALLGGLLAFVLFCCVSSGFYLINDLADVESDRQHPVKCKRPIAAGVISLPMAVTMAVVLLGAALFIGWFKARGLGSALTAYVLLQIVYNIKLKRVVILDIAIIATGFVLRAFAGASSTGVTISPWFLICTAMLALFLAIEKRKAELRLLEIKGGTTRSVLQYYSMHLLSRMENIVTTTSIVTYILWSSGPQFRGASTPWMLVTVPFVLYGVFRYQFLSDPQEIVRRQDLGEEQGGKTERPEEILLTDKPILLTVIGWLASVLLVLFLKQQGWLLQINSFGEHLDQLAN